MIRSPFTSRRTILLICVGVIAVGAFIIALWEMRRIRDRSLSIENFESFCQDLMARGLQFQGVEVMQTATGQSVLAVEIKSRLKRAIPKAFASRIETHFFTRGTESIALRASITGRRVTVLEILANQNALELAETIRERVKQTNRDIPVTVVPFAGTLDTEGQF